jgi:two-component system alkaline phosphatase synthesis response regulator PhoP
LIDMSKVLIIEDDREISDLISIHLKDMELEVSQAYDGKNGLLKAVNEPFDLIILDLRLPYLDGLEICKKIRMEKVQSLVLILTSKSEEIDKVLGLEIGADDYLTKPFSIRELVARVKALLRRREMILTSQDTEVEDKELKIGDLMINESMRKVQVGGTNIDLSPKEFDLLLLLASNPGKTYTRMQLLNKIWGYEFEGFEHTVNSHINRLRSKVEKNMHKPEYILTTWGIGYKFRES